MGPEGNDPKKRLASSPALPLATSKLKAQLGAHSYWVTFVLALVLVSLLVGTQLRRDYHKAVAEWEIRQTSVADERQRMVSAWLRERLHDAEALASRPLVIAALSSPGALNRPGVRTLFGPGVLALSLKKYSQPFGYSGVYVLDPSGRIVSRSEGAPELEPAAREAYIGVSRTGRARIDLLGSLPGRIQLSFCAPIWREEMDEPSLPPQASPLGTVALLTDPVQALFPQLLMESVPTRSGEVVLVQREGDEIAYFAPLRNTLRGAPPVRRPFNSATIATRAALEGRETFGEFTDYRGVSVLAATRRIRETGWGLVCKIDRSEAFEDFYHMARLEVLAAVILLGALGGLMLAHRRYVLSAASKKEQERFRALVQATAQIVWTMNSKGEVEDIPDWRAFTGQSLEEVKGQGWANAVHPDDRPRTLESWAEAVKARAHYETEFRIRHKDGEYRYFSARSVPVLNKDGSIREWVGFCSDITRHKQTDKELRRLNRALRTLSDCNQVMVRTQDESELLQNICRILVEVGGYRLAWVGYAENDEAKTVRPVAHAGYEDGYLALVHASWGDNERGRGPTGTAIRSGSPYICRDFQQDPLFAPWVKEATRRGYAASIALPLVVEGQTLGGLMLYSPTTESFEEEEVKLLLELSLDLAYGIQALRTRTERIQASEALRKSLTYNRSLLEAGLDPLVTISPDGKITDLNSATELITGRRREELVGTDFSDYFTEPEKARAGYQQVFHQGWVKDYELEVRHYDGRTTPVLYNATVYRDESGQVMGVFAAARDISERKDAEKTIGLQADQHRTLVATTSDGYWRFDEHGCLLDVNEAYCRMSGYARAELLSLSIPDIEAVETPEDVARHIQQVKQKGFGRFESRHRRKDGSIFDVEVSVSYAQAIGQFFLFARDITERKRAEEALRKSEAELKEAQRVAHLGHWTMEVKTGEVTWSEELYRMLGLDPSRPVLPYPEQWRLFTPESWALLSAELEKTVRAGVPYEVELEMLRADGTRGWMLARGEAVRDAQGIITTLHGVALDITERKRAEQALRRANDYNRSLIEASLDPLATIAPDGKITDVNSAAENVTGHSREELVGTDFCDYFTDPEKARAGYQQVFREGHVHDYELGIRHRDGQITPVLYNASVYRDEAAQVIGVFAAARDISERIRAEKQARVHARQQAVIAELGHHALAGADLLVLMEEAVRRVADTLAVEYCKVLELLPDGKSLLLRAGVGWKEGLVGKGTVGASLDSQAGFTLLSRDPVIVEDLRNETRFSGPPLLHEHGVVSGLSTIIAGATRPYGVLGAHSKRSRKFSQDDVHFLQAVANVLATAIERKRLEAAERRANAYNRSLIEASLDPLVTISSEGKITDINSATEQVTGRSGPELIGTDFSNYFTDPRRASAVYLQVFREGHVHNYELEIRHREGHVTPVLYNASVYRDETGEVIGVLAAARDITERRRAEEQVRKLNESLERRVLERTSELETANKELEAFTYSVSHDLRAPLRHVDGFSKLLAEEYGDDLEGDGTRYLTRIREATRRMGRMVDDLLNLARIGRKELSVQLTGLGTLLEEVRRDLEAENSGRQIEWKISSLPFVECDPALIKQVFVNLLSNALKFTRPRDQAVIEVGTTTRSGRQAVFVRDNGVGFRMKYADKLFGVFQRLHRQEDFEGTGVGLATVQRIVQKHGGQVWAEAELNQGATFYFSLGPAEQSPAVDEKKVA